MIIMDARVPVCMKDRSCWNEMDYSVLQKMYTVQVFSLKVHKRENFFGSDFEFYTFL